MDKVRQFLSGRSSLRFTATLLIGLLLLARIGYGQIANQKQGILQASIHLAPAQLLPGAENEKIQPGTAVKLAVSVENKGMQASPSAELYMRFALAPPLENEKSSVIFKSEKKPLPSIEPGKHIEIAFETPHHTPALSDFVRNDWPSREYQAIAVINGKEYMIGSLAITYSAYYYPGTKKELPMKVVQ